MKTINDPYKDLNRIALTVLNEMIKQQHLDIFHESTALQRKRRLVRAFERALPVIKKILAPPKPRFPIYRRPLRRKSPHAA